MFTPDFVCSNPACRSFGRRHPNCRCESEGQQYALGGAVHFCSHKSSHDYNCEMFADGGDVVANESFGKDPSLAVDHAIAHSGLLHALSRSGYTKSEEPHRAHTEFVDASRKGREMVFSHSNGLLNPKHPDIERNEGNESTLESKLNQLHNNPEAGLDIGGDLRDTLPDHGALLAAKAAGASNYLKSISPKSLPSGHLDNPLPPSSSQQRNYKRQVGLIENPSLLFQYIRDGSVTPTDLASIEAVYPKLRNQMKAHAFSVLADAKANDKKLSYKEKRKLGTLLGEPTLLQQSVASSQAIMAANRPSQQMPQAPEKKPKKASGVELKQLNEVNKLSETPLQRLQTSRNS